MRKNGFTLVELLVTISILGILTVIAIPTLRAFQNSNSKTQYVNYKKSLTSSGKLYNDSYSEDLFGNASFGCQKVDLTEMMYKKVAKDIDLKDVSCNISSKDSYIIVKKYNNEYKYYASLYCENSSHVEQYSDKDDIISDCINDTGVPWIDIESKNNTTNNTKKKSVVIKLLDNYGFTANQSIKYAWTTSESAPADSSTLWKKYNYNNQVKKSNGGTVTLKSNYITIPETTTGKYYLYVRPIKVQNILNSSFTETKKYGPFRFDHTAPQCNQITVTPNVNANSYSKVVKFNFTYASSLDDLKGYSLLISYDNGSHWTTVKTNANRSYTSYTVDKDGDIRYKLVNLVDYAGNKTNECSMSAVYHRDTKPPTCSINIGSTKSTTSGYYYTPAKFNLTSSEINSISYGMNTTASKTYNGKKTITVNSDGNNGIHGYVKDKAGNEGKCDKSATTTKKYTITFNGNGGTPNPKTKAVYWGDKIGSLASISRYGYNLSGWFNANTGGSVVNASTIMPRRNVTYYARWTPKKVTVTFNCNGGSGGGSQTFTYGASNQKFGKTCSRSGYTIDGWKLNKNGSSRDYATNSGVSNDWINSKSPSVTVYAHWKSNTKTVTVTFNGNGGTANSSSLTCKYNTTTASSCTVKAPGITRKNWTIDGWAKTDTAKKAAVKVGGNITVSGDTTYYAVTHKSVKASFSFNLGTYQNINKLNNGSRDTSKSCTRYNKMSCSVTTPKCDFGKTHNSKSQHLSSYFDCSWDGTKAGKDISIKGGEKYTLTVEANKGKVIALSHSGSENVVVRVDNKNKLYNNGVSSSTIIGIMDDGHAFNWDGSWLVDKSNNFLWFRGKTVSKETKCKKAASSTTCNGSTSEKLTGWISARLTYRK